MNTSLKLFYKTILIVKIFVLILIFPLNLFAQNSWEPFPIDIYLGNLSGLASNSKGEIFGHASGLYKTSDKGNSWTKVSNLPKQNSMIINSKDQIFISNYGAIMRSDDGGVTFDTISNNLPGWPNKLIIDSLDNIYSLGDSGIFKSVNNGNSWEKISYGISKYAYIEDLAFVNNYFFACDDYTGVVYKSKDGGSSWSKIESEVLNDVKVHLLFPKDTLLFAGTNHGIFRSNDFGNSWSLVNYGIDIPLSFQWVYQILPDNEGNILSTVHGTSYISSDDGENWERIFPYPGLPGYSSLLYIDRDDYIYFSIGIGILRFKDDVLIKADYGLQLTKITNLVIDNADNMYLETQLGMFLSKDYGMNWSQIILDSSKDIFADDLTWNIIEGKDEVYAISDSTLYRSTDGGLEWNLTSDISDLMRNNTLTEIIVNPYNGDLFAASFEHVFKSEDHGFTWARSDSGLPHSPVYSYAFCKNGYIFLGFIGGIFISKDNGIIWDTLGLQVNSPVILTSNSNDQIFTAEDDGNYLYRSIDYGETWESFLVTDSESLIFNATLDPFNDSTLIYHVISSNENHKNGILISRDNGETWNTFNEGLPSLSLNFLDFDNENHLYVQIVSTGRIYKSKSIITAISDDKYISIKNYFLAQNYPNPFNPSTTINYSIPKESFVILKVYNILGKVVATLVNQKQNQGNHKVKFSGGNFSSGVYFYKLTSGDFHQTKKMLLLK